jgi:ABC-type sugar transport system ATPase subunit
MSDTTLNRTVPRSAAAHPETAPMLLEVEDLNVSYGQTKALVDASIAVRRGEVHALIGENGCGKSTLVKTISGIVRPGSGTLTWQGEVTSLRRPREAQRRGIVTVFQETLVADELSILDNLCLGQGGTFRRGHSRAEAERMAVEQMSRLGLGNLDLHQPMWRLPLSRRHLVAIGRALTRPWDLLLLDEATSALDIEDRERLFTVIREGAAEGRGILYISHRLDEIETLADTVTVLRSGRTVGVLDRTSMSRQEIVRLMSPPTRVARERVDRAASRAPSEGAPVLRVEGARLDAAGRTFDLDVRAGEILGLAGLEGHGHARFLRCLAGWESLEEGTVVASEPGTGDSSEIRNAIDASRAQVAYVPGDRKREGIFAASSVEDNLTLPALRRYSRMGLLDLGRMRAAAAGLSERMRLVAASPKVAIETLSGGNQQKVVLGRWIATSPRVLLLDDPMRGVDVNSKADIMAVLSELVAEGVSLVLLSTEVEELVDVCHRVAVFREQSLHQLLPREALDEETLVAAMLGEGAER